MRLFRLYGIMLLSMLIAVCLYSCGGDDDEPVAPPPPADKITIPATENTKPVFGTEGGTATLTFTASKAWTATTTNADGWLTISPTSGGAGVATITMTTTANEATDDRIATIALKSGTASQTINVTQKQKDALTISGDKFELDAEGGEIHVEVKANIDFSIKTDVDWITQADTRAMKTSNLTFNIKGNKTIEQREGHITIHSGDFSETLTVSQAAAAPFLSIAEKEFELDTEEGEISVVVKTNVEVKVSLPKGGWIKQSSKSTVSDDEISYVFTVAKNDTYDERKGEIVFSNEQYGLKEKAVVTQKQKDAIIVNKNDFSFSIEGGTIDLEVKSNVDYQIDINAGWISQTTTRGLNTNQLHFVVDANNSSEKREAVITLYAEGIKQEIKVQQRGVVFVSSIELNKTSLELYVGDTAQLTATITPSNADNKTLYWNSQSWDIASVDGYGLVTAWNEGSTIVYVYTDNRVKAECQVTVKKHTFTNGNESFGNENQDW